jgi:transcriptional regulator with XRE-family HTH domain
MWQECNMMGRNRTPTDNGEVEGSNKVINLDRQFEREQGKFVPRHLSKLEFGERLHKLAMSRGLNQSDLARATGLTRDNISTYILGKSLPTAANLKALADFFQMSVEELLPNRVEEKIEAAPTSFEIKTSATSPNKAWLRVNRLVRLSTAVKIAELIEAEERAHVD